MKKKRRLLQSDTLWGLTAALLVLLQFWWLPGEDGSAADSYSTTIDGKLALFRTLSELFPRVERDPLQVVPETAASLLIIAPDRYPNEAEQQQLYEFVYHGGKLLFTPNWSEPESSIPSLGIEFSERLGVESDESMTSMIEGDRVQATSVLVDGDLEFRATALLHVPRHFESEELLVSGSGIVEAATWNLGNGRVVVCSSPDIFSNRSLLYKNSRRLAVRLVERCMAQESDSDSADDDLVILSEYFNASDAFQQSGVLFSPSLRIGTLQLLLTAVLGIWLSFHRFGPATEVTTLQRRSLTESAQAVGNLQFGLRDGGAVVRSYLEYLRSQLRRRYGSFLRLEDPDEIANRSGLSRAEVSDQLREAHGMAESSQLSPARAAAMLRWLSGLQQRLTGTRPRAGQPPRVRNR